MITGKKQSLQKQLFSGLILLIFVACGGPSDGQVLRNAGGLPVSGAAAFGSQCPYGSIAQPVPTSLELWGCPIGLDRIELAKPLEPLFLQGDCKRKVINVRMGDHKLDTAWEIMPDGSFSFSVDGGVALLNSDGPNRGPCSTTLSAELMGKMDCSNRDQAKIALEAVWWMGRSNSQDRASPNSKCQLPSGCYLYAHAKIDQCT